MEAIIEDPIVNEVRNAGKKLEEECSNDIEKFIKMIKIMENKRKKSGWKFVDKEDLVKV